MVIALVAGALTLLPSVQQEPSGAGRPDLMTFAHGALPVAVQGAGADRGATLEDALRIIDGDPRGFTLVDGATDETDTEFVYALPSPTTFDRFAVPNVLETPSPSQTFTRLVEVHGSSRGPGGPWTLLARGSLSTHDARGRVTELDLESSVPVRWVKLRLAGGIEMLRDAMFLEFSEIVGNGTQETPPLEGGFTGAWRGRGVHLELEQDGPAVRGCYDRDAPLTATVTGNLLKGRGVDPRDGTVSLFILGLDGNGAIRGVRSDNGAPFRYYTGESDPGGFSECPDPETPILGCGSVVHGVRFDFDSDVIRPESEPVLAGLFDGLREEGAVVVEGHTSSEGTDEYNLDLSERRARAVVADLVERGMDPDRIQAAGRGESVPIAPNDTESGRAMNRRVEIRCGRGEGGSPRPLDAIATHRNRP